MTGKTPKTAPKTAPKKVDEADNGVPNWKNHWHSNYHDPRIVLYRGKYAIAVTKPPALQKRMIQTKNFQPEQLIRTLLDSVCGK